MVEMIRKKNAALLLENGAIFHGIAENLVTPVTAELVFNTALFGYQEIITDQSYKGQAVLFTSPHIGVVGCNDVDRESPEVSTSFIVTRVLEQNPSNYRAQTTLLEFLQHWNTPVVYGINTRTLTAILRDSGPQYATLLPFEYFQQHPVELLLQNLHQQKNAAVTQFCGVQHNVTWEESTYTVSENNYDVPVETEKHVVLYDFGIKYNIPRILRSLGVCCTLVPANTSLETLLSLRPDGVCFSNGPGNPTDYSSAITLVQQLLQKNIPLLGICLGCQIFALALGATTYKMSFAHHGSNHPVFDVRRKTVSITSQNHGYAVDSTTLPKNAIITHYSLFDGSLQGFSLNTPPLIAFQGHPEASPGPHDIASIFEEFFALL